MSNRGRFNTALIVSAIVFNVVYPNVLMQGVVFTVGIVIFIDAIVGMIRTARLTRKV